MRKLSLGVLGLMLVASIAAFASTGGCHVHRSVGTTGEVSTFGPDLSDRRFPTEYLARFLADPSIKPSTNGKRMPSLGLRDKDIAPLVAFINASQSSP